MYTIKVKPYFIYKSSTESYELEPKNRNLPCNCKNRNEVVMMRNIQEIDR